MMRWSLQIFLSCALSLPVLGQHILYLDGRDDYSLDGHVRYYMDTAWLAPQQVFEKIKQGKGKILHDNRFSEAPLGNLCWLYLRVQNDSNNKRLIFRAKRQDIHHFEAFKKTNTRINTLTITGDAYPFSQRTILAGDLCFLLTLAPNEKAEVLVLLDKRWEELNLSFSLQEEKAFYHTLRQDYNLVFFYIGAAFFILVFNIFLWIQLKDRVHFYYTLFLVCHIWLVLGTSGLGFEYIWPNFTYQTSVINTFLSVFALIVNLLFMSQLLDLKYKSFYYSFVSFLIRVLCSIIILSLPALLIKLYQYPTWLILGYRYMSLVLITASVITHLLVMIEQIKKQNDTAKIYVLSQTFIYVATFMYVLSVVSRVSWVRTSEFLIWGNLLEIITLTFGLTIRYNSFKQHSNDLALQLAETQNAATKQIIQTQEAERSRLAQDLHDDLGGTLSALKGRIANESMQLETLDLIEKAINDLRIVSRNLLPPELEKEGLIKATQYTTERLQSASKIEFTYVVFGKEVRLPKEYELNLYRIVAELLNNVVKHAKATKAVVQLIFHADYLYLSVEDNGEGIKTETNVWGIGLKNISSRVEFLKASLSVDSTPKKGTTVIVEIPYPS